GPLLRERHDCSIPSWVSSRIARRPLLSPGAIGQQAMLSAGRHDLVRQSRTRVAGVGADSPFGFFSRARRGPPARRTMTPRLVIVSTPAKTRRTRTGSVSEFGGPANGRRHCVAQVSQRDRLSDAI